MLSSQSHFVHVMKNWQPFVFGPLFACVSHARSGALCHQYISMADGRRAHSTDLDFPTSNASPCRALPLQFLAAHSGNGVTTVASVAAPGVSLVAPSGQGRESKAERTANGRTGNDRGVHRSSELPLRFLRMRVGMRISAPPYASLLSCRSGASRHMAGTPKCRGGVRRYRGT